MHRTNGMNDTLTVKLGFMHRQTFTLGTGQSSFISVLSCPYQPFLGEDDVHAQEWFTYTHLYQQYSCTYATMTFTLLNHDYTGNANSVGWGYMVIGTAPSNLDPPASIYDVMNNPRKYRYKMIHYGFPTVKKWKMKVRSSIHHAFGRKFDPFYDITDVNSVPVDLTQMTASIYDMGTGGGNHNFELLLSVKFHTKFYMLRNLASASGSGDRTPCSIGPQGTQQDQVCMDAGSVSDEPRRPVILNLLRGYQGNQGLQGPQANIETVTGPQGFQGPQGT